MITDIGSILKCYSLYGTETYDGVVYNAYQDPNHNYKKEMSYDNITHWYECSGCGNRKEEEKHSWNENGDDYICSVCEGNVSLDEIRQSFNFAEMTQVSNSFHIGIIFIPCVLALAVIMIVICIKKFYE